MTTPSITIEQQIAEQERLLKNFCQNDYALKMGEAILASLRELKAAQWISVKDRLPEDEVPVLIYEPGRMMIRSCRYARDWLLPHKSNVTHWKPIAPPNDAEVKK